MLDDSRLIDRYHDFVVSLYEEVLKELVIEDDNRSEHGTDREELEQEESGQIEHKEHHLELVVPFVRVSTADHLAEV